MTGQALHPHIHTDKKKKNGRQLLLCRSRSYELSNDESDPIKYDHEYRKQGEGRRDTTPIQHTSHEEATIHITSMSVKLSVVVDGCVNLGGQEGKTYIRT